MGESVGIDNGVDGERFGEIKERAPVEGFDVLVEEVGGVGLEGVEGFEDAQGGTAAEVCFVKHFEVAFESYHASAGFHIFSAESTEFVGEYGFKALEGLGHHFKVSIHRVNMLI